MSVVSLVLVLMQCSLRCGRGVKRRTVQCVSGGKGGVDDTLCPGRRPPDTRFCFKYQCPYAWHSTDWSEVAALDTHAHFSYRKRYISKPTQEVFFYK
jgi:Thrombospondin type 1 domain